MDKTEFENGVAVKFWLDSLPSKPRTRSTKYIWLHHLKRFCDWIGKALISWLKSVSMLTVVRMNVLSTELKWMLKSLSFLKSRV